MEERRAKKRQREGGAGGEPMGKEGEENAQKKIRTHGQRPIKDAQGPRAKVSSKLLSMLGGAE